MSQTTEKKWFSTHPTPRTNLKIHMKTHIGHAIDTEIAINAEFSAPAETTFGYFIRKQIEDEYMEVDETINYTAISYTYSE